MKVERDLRSATLRPKLDRLWLLSAQKIHAIECTVKPADGAPVFTVHGRYTARGWTEWTQGFQFGSALLQFDATGDEPFLELGRRKTVTRMAAHLTHFGVHDHGFNNVSTYGNLLRLLDEGRLPANPWERNCYTLALKVSGAVQARRWTALKDGGYIHSFNGPHSLFIDTLRSLRALAIAHQLGHVLMDENDRTVSLLERLRQHATSTAKLAVFYGEGRDIYDIRGRVAQESLFNVTDGSYRCPGSQQGFSPFSTWTRGLAWGMLGFAEQVEFLSAIGEQKTLPLLLRAAQATCDFYLANTPSDGIPYWDTGAPGLAKLGDYLNRPAEPFNAHEPVDSSAAAIAAQGLLRLGRYLSAHATHRAPKSSGQKPTAHDTGRKYWQAGLTVLNTLLGEPYLSTAPKHQGLLLHSIYHRPNGWDYVPREAQAPCGESSMWGDYHLREAALYLQRIIENKPYLTFWGKL